MTRRFGINQDIAAYVDSWRGPQFLMTEWIIQAEASGKSHRSNCCNSVITSPTPS